VLVVVLVEYTVVLFFARYLCSLQQLLLHTQDTRPGVCPCRARGAPQLDHSAQAHATRATQFSQSARPPRAPPPRAHLRAPCVGVCGGPDAPPPRTPHPYPRPQPQASQGTALGTGPTATRASFLHFVRAEAQIAAQYTHTTVSTKVTRHTLVLTTTPGSAHSSRVCALVPRAAARCPLGLAAAPRAANS
jgi:hypothetical protein